MTTKKAATIKLSGNDYAKVAERIRLFRQDNPFGEIKTEPKFLEGGRLMFTAFVQKDRRDPNSATANGHSISDESGKKAGNKSGDGKDFEKLETVAVGRALANLGYLASGDVASSEEMEEFIEHKEQRRKDRVAPMIADIETAEDLEALKAAFMRSDMADPDVIAAKDRRKAALTPKPEKVAV